MQFAIASMMNNTFKKSELFIFAYNPRSVILYTLILTLHDNEEQRNRDIQGDRCKALERITLIQARNKIRFYSKYKKPPLYLIRDLVLVDKIQGIKYRSQDVPMPSTLQIE